MVEFSKIEKSNTLDAVIKALRDYIIGKNMQPGDRLPTENELSVSLGISRNIIREGMRYFRTLGIIESKPRLGAVIGRLVPDNPFAGYLPFLLNDPQRLQEAVQMRQIIEYGAVPLILRHCREEDIAYLRHQVARLTDRREALEAEINFHTRLLIMTGNLLLRSMIPLTVEFFSRHSPPPMRRTEEIVAEHEEIVAALDRRDEPRLFAAVKAHYSIFNNG